MNTVQRFGFDGSSRSSSTYNTSSDSALQSPADSPTPNSKTRSEIAFAPVVFPTWFQMESEPTTLGVPSRMSDTRHPPRRSTPIYSLLSTRRQVVGGVFSD